MASKKKKKSKKTATKSSKVKLVSKAFLNGLADKIYSRKTGKFLKMCDGSLTLKGEDGKTMHCGLGELYFAMTGSPDTRGQTEAGIVGMAITNSTLFKEVNSEIKKTNALLSKIPARTRSLVETKRVDESDIDEFTVALRYTLEEIQDANDSVGEDDYMSRAIKVSDLLRKAAILLP